MLGRLLLFCSSDFLILGSRQKKHWGHFCCKEESRIMGKTCDVSERVCSDTMLITDAPVPWSTHHSTNLASVELETYNLTKNIKRIHGNNNIIHFMCWSSDSFVQTHLQCELPSCRSFLGVHVNSRAPSPEPWMLSSLLSAASPQPILLLPPSCLVLSSQTLGIHNSFQHNLLCVQPVTFRLVRGTGFQIPYSTSNDMSMMMMVNANSYIVLCKFFFWILGIYKHI